MVARSTPAIRPSPYWTQYETSCFGSYVVAAMYRLIRKRAEKLAPMLAAHNRKAALINDDKPTRSAGCVPSGVTYSVAPNAQQTHQRCHRQHQQAAHQTYRTEDAPATAASRLLGQQQDGARGRGSNEPCELCVRPAQGADFCAAIGTRRNACRKLC